MFPALVSKSNKQTRQIPEDDGITQNITVKKRFRGSVGKENVKPIVRLSSLSCSFREIEQPESQFLLRIIRTEDGIPHIALILKLIAYGQWRTRQERL